jgi:hypothetical protein
MHDLRANSAAAHEQAFVDEVLNCAANSGSREIQSLPERHFIFEPRTSGEATVENRFFNPLLNLKIEGDGPVSVEGQKETGHDVGCHEHPLSLRGGCHIVLTM